MNDDTQMSKETLISELDAARTKIKQLEAITGSTEHQTLDTQLSETEQTLRNFGVKFQNIIDASPVPYALNDDQQNIIYLNPAFTQTFGYRLSDIPTLNDWWPKAYPDADYRQWVSETWIKHLDKAIKHDTTFEPIELKIQCKDGSERFILASAASITESFKDIHLVTLFDITERYQSRKVLEQTVTLLENVINSTPDLIFVKDTELRTILCNHAYADAVGKNREEMYGNTDIENGWDPELVMGNEKKGVRGFVHDDRDALSGIALHNPHDPANVNGEVHIFDTRKLPLKDSNGNIMGLLGVARDITTRVKTENQLRHSQKMDALGKLTGGIAHDFNNMLGVVLGYSELLEEKQQDEKQLKYIKAIIQAANRAKSLTSKLLAFSRKQSSDAERIDINEVLKRDQHMLEKTLTAQIKLNLFLADKLWPTFLDADLLTDAILNMSINSMHAMPKGGELTLQTININIPPTQSNELPIVPGDYIQLVITDTGSGMDKHTREHLFEPFFSTKGESGTGLGLSQVYGFIQQSKGHITVESTEDIGTTFTIYFPRYDETDASVSESMTDPTSDIKCKGESILIVDDEPSLRHLATDILASQNYQVHCAENAADALELLQHTSVDLMITDVIMPVMNGLALSKEIQKLYPHIKILITSGYSDDLNISEIDKELLEQRLKKPYKPNDLLEKVNSLLNNN